ncbi:MAG: isoleucine--tRNA ligase, partial [Candidatus Zixiibacteriota bacterium]
YGVAEFNKKCRESVFRYKKEWDELTTRIGYWLDLDKAYITCSNEYIESVWWILSQYWKKELIYTGHKIVPYCPRCETSLSSHEVAQGYEQVKDPSVTIKMKLEDEENTHFLVWTTTPWTLISNVALAMGRDITYSKVEYKGEKLILAKALLDSVLKGEYKILEEFEGEKLERKRYQPLYSFAETEKGKAFYVCLADFVSTEEGTGIVHIAPAFGADDYELSRVYDLPVVQPVDTSGKFTDEITPWKGMFVKDADPQITQDLRDRGILFDEGMYLHTYPFCWRCESPLLYYARKSWYIRTTAYKDKLLSNNNRINWYPPEIGAKRFGEWLENNVDWALSRERYWGTPLNLWLCDSCEEIKSVSSIEELKGLCKNLPENLDLHKPMIDTVTFPCSKCKGEMHRTPEVIDCWFDTGSMPYAQWHYPFEDKDKFEERFPSDFISEGVDQTRGWFYSLLAISAFLFDQPAYKNVIVIELIQDKDGAKMSKSKGNVIDPREVLDVQGADALRWYLVSVSHPWLPTRVSKEAITEVSRKLLSTLRNTYSFFALYANIDDFDPTKFESKPKLRSLIDRWLLSELHHLVKDVNDFLDRYDITRAARAIQEFVIEDLSNWWVRRNRRRFWQSGFPQDKVDAYMTLWETMVTVAKLIAPYTPFIAEELYQELVAKLKKDAPLSVHLTLFPVADENLIDQALEEKMKILMKLASLGLAARNKAGIKVRQPLEKMLVFIPQKKLKEELKSMFYVVEEEINVKSIDFAPEELSFTVKNAKPNFQLLGPKFGKDAAQVAERVKRLNEEELNKLKKEGRISLKFQDGSVEISSDEIHIEEKEKPGFAVESENEYQVALSIELTESLKDEGFARELVNKIQNMRKSAGFEVMDRITIDIQSTDRLYKALVAFEEYIKKETLANTISRKGDNGEFSEELDINGQKTRISVSRT